MTDKRDELISALALVVHTLYVDLASSSHGITTPHAWNEQRLKSLKMVAEAAAEWLAASMTSKD